MFRFITAALLVIIAVLPAKADLRSDCESGQQSACVKYHGQLLRDILEKLQSASQMGNIADEIKANTAAAKEVLSKIDENTKQAAALTGDVNAVKLSTGQSVVAVNAAVAKSDELTKALQENTKKSDAILAQLKAGDGGAEALKQEVDKLLGFLKSTQMASFRVDHEGELDCEKTCTDNKYQQAVSCVPLDDFRRRDLGRIVYPYLVTCKGVE